VTYHTGPVETYQTALGCNVVRQQQTTSAGVLIEHVALIGPKEIGDGLGRVESDGRNDLQGSDKPEARVVVARQASHGDSAVSLRSMDSRIEDRDHEGGDR
jgi:hypothetical protein